MTVQILKFKEDSTQAHHKLLKAKDKNAGSI